MNPKEHRREPWLRRWLPHPLLSLVLLVLWVALVSRLETTVALVGAVLAITIPIVTRRIWEHSPKLARFGGVSLYLLIVFWDVAVANLQVAWLILVRPRNSLRSCWLSVPLDLESEEAIAVLAATITLTPGTVSCDLSADRSCLLVHGLDVEDRERLVSLIKSRYESRLKAIFR